MSSERNIICRPRKTAAKRCGQGRKKEQKVPKCQMPRKCDQCCQRPDPSPFSFPPSSLANMLVPCNICRPSTGIWRQNTLRKSGVIRRILTQNIPVVDRIRTVIHPCRCPYSPKSEIIRKRLNSREHEPSHRGWKPDRQALTPADLAVARTGAAALVVFLDDIAEAGGMMMPRHLFPGGTRVVGS